MVANSTQNCLVGCIREFAIGNLSLPVDVEMLSPWVRVNFVNEDTSITVGNKSYPSRDNTAVIKSFEYGLSDGLMCKIEIVDEEGGSFEKFFDNMIKCIGDLEREFFMSVEWGWTKKTCFGNSNIIESKTPKLFLIPVSMDVNFANGIVKYTIGAPDPIQIAFASRTRKEFGTSTNEMPLKEAIRELCRTSCPRFDVKFLSRNIDGTINTQEWEFKDNPKGSWKANNQNKLSIITDWTKNYVTENDKGIFVQWDNMSEEGKPSIILWENNDSEHKALQTLGTFIVNGGTCSNVLEFNPTINWVAPMANKGTGGGTGSSVTAETTETSEEGQGLCDSGEPGIQENVSISEDAINNYGREATKKVIESLKENSEAQSQYTPTLTPIEAELTIQGNTNMSYIDVRKIVGLSASVVVINPFHIRGSGDDCGRWLAKPGCNRILTNKKWMVKGVNHSITDGSYKTSLKLVLVNPEPEGGSMVLGGKGSGGYIVTKAC